jgi:hypothetical protein
VEVDELYGLTLDSFVPERTALAKALRADGRRDDAAAVAGLRKPSVAAWAVNQLVRTQGAALAELFDAGDGLRAAQSDVLARRGDSADLRAAVERERNVVDALVDTARGLLSSEGHELSPTILDRVAETLHAAAVSDNARRAISEGRLERELRRVGLGVDAAVGAIGAIGAIGAVGAGGAGAARKPTPRKPTPRKPPRAQAKADAAPAKPAKPDVRAVARERGEARRAARVAEGDARRQLDLATRALKAAHGRRELAAQALAEADADVAAAEAEAAAAERAHAVAKATLESF